MLFRITVLMVERTFEVRCFEEVFERSLGSFVFCGRESDSSVLQWVFLYEWFFCVSVSYVI